MEAVLRLAAMSLVNLACFFGMRLSRLVRECHTDGMPEVLPQRESEPTTKDTEQAARERSRTMIGTLTAINRESSSGKARQRRIPRIPVRETRELSTSPTADPTGILGTRRLRALAENDSRESLRLPRRTRPRIRGHIAPI
jgi:hypothetical protein